MQKLIFIDIDGTLCDHNGEIPNTTKQAIQQAKANGHLLYLCTGRALAEIIPEIQELNFDGIIGSNGGYIQVNDTVIFHKTIPYLDLVEILTFFKEHKIEYYLECNAGIYASNNCATKIIDVTSTYFKNRNAAEFKWFTDLLIPINDDELKTLAVNKISFINTTTPFEKIRQQFANQYELLQATVVSFGEFSGEIALPGISKKTAIKKLCNYLNIDEKDTIGIGDGNNDVPMLEAVAYFIAMGNATNQLKALANEVTADVDQDGFYLSFKKNKLI